MKPRRYRTRADRQRFLEALASMGERMASVHARVAQETAFEGPPSDDNLTAGLTVLDSQMAELDAAVASFEPVAKHFLGEGRAPGETGAQYLARFYETVTSDRDVAAIQRRNGIVELPALPQAANLQ